MVLDRAVIKRDIKRSDPKRKDRNQRVKASNKDSKK